MTSSRALIFVLVGLFFATSSYAILPGEPGPGDVTLSKGRLANLSCRGSVGTGESSFILGFIVSGGKKAVVIRALGPSLKRFGIGGYLTNPTFTIYDAAGTPIRDSIPTSAPSTRESFARAFTSVGAFPLDPQSSDAALVTVLDEGAYTMSIRGAPSETGVVLGKVYEFSGELLLFVPEIWGQPKKG